MPNRITITETYCTLDLILRGYGSHSKPGDPRGFALAIKDFTEKHLPDHGLIESVSWEMVTDQPDGYIYNLTMKIQK